MSSSKFIKFLILLAIIVLVTIPLCAFLDMDANAGSTTESITSHNDDYVFFVVDEGKTPLAAAPIAASTTFNPVVWIVASTFLFVLGVCYVSWYLILRHNTKTFVNKLPSYLRNRRTIKASILHPIRSLEYSNDMAYDVARNYIKR